jgi:hypothetical protein
MHRSAVFIFLLASGAWWHMATPAAAQRSAGRLYVAKAAARGTVSPYLNLGYNANGLSNYTTLVRPMLNNREAAARELVEPEQRRRMPHAGRDSAEPESAPANSERGGKRRFLNYSHYFGGVQ